MRDEGQADITRESQSRTVSQMPLWNTRFRDSRLDEGSLDVTEFLNIQTIIGNRAHRRGYHVASSEHVRVEFRNFSTSEEIRPFSYAGNVILTCYRGSFRVALDGLDSLLAELDQVVIEPDTQISLACQTPGTLQVIWAPGFAATTQN
jgi:hypothetical protein